MTENRMLILALGKSDGGTAQYAREIINHTKVKDKIELFVSQQSYHNWDELKHIKIFKIPTYTNKIGFIISTLFIYPCFLFFVFIKLLLNKFDVLYIPYFHHWEYGVIRLFRLFNKKIVYTVHDGIHHDGEYEVLGQNVMLSSIKNSTDVIFLTNYVMRLVERKIGEIKWRKYIIPHGLIRYHGLKIKKQINDIPVILFFGRIIKYKGVELLIEAIPKLHVKAKIIIAGKKYYDIKFPDLPLLTVIGKWLTNDEVVQLINQADILVLPYNEATQSGVITLGIAAHVPIITTDVGGLREQLANGGLYVDLNSTAIALTIDNLLTDRTLYTDLQARLKNQADSLQWANIANQIEQICFSGK